MAERISFKTRDGVTIVGNWQAAPTTIGAAILLHSMPETKASWGLVQRALSAKGIASLAIDLRGHGDSTQGPGEGKLDYRAFTDDEHQDSMLDVISAIQWVRSRGLELGRIGFGGASIGANLAIQALTDEPTMLGGFFLSAAENYRGIMAVDDIQKVPYSQAFLFIAAQDDPEAFGGTSHLYETAPVETKELLPLKDGGHGTNILTNHPELIDKTAAWFDERLKG